MVDVDLKSALLRLAEHSKSTRCGLRQAARIFESEGKFQEAKLLKKLSKPKFFAYADKNMDGILSENEIKRLSRIDGDADYFSFEDFYRMKNEEGFAPKVEKKVAWDVQFPSGFRIVRYEDGKIEYFFPKTLKKQALSKIGDFLSMCGFKGYAETFYKLSKDEVYDKADLNADGTLSYDEIDHLCGYDGNGKTFALEDVDRMDEGRKHVLDALDYVDS